MIYVSDILGKLVIDADGQRFGRLQDILASGRSSPSRPQLVAIAVKRPGDKPLLIAMPDVAVLVGPAVVLARRLGDISPYAPADELWLARDVMDKEIIDIDRARVVRVNDLQVLRVNGGYRLASVVIGGLAILRRLGLARLFQRLARLVGGTVTPNTVSWEHVEALPGNRPVRLRFSPGKAVDLSPADLAEIISDLNPVESSKVIEQMDVEKLADTLEEVEPDFQASLIKSLPDEKVADVLEEMEPDEAADLLAELPQERSNDLLGLMDEEEAQHVRRLLTYREDTAGGLMTTDVASVRLNLTVEQAMAELRKTAQDKETLYYVYVTDEDNHLVGVFSLQKLVLADPATPLRDIVHGRVVSVNLRDTQNETAKIVTKYNLLAVPVVDDDNRLQGIVTADDALDKIIPTAWKKRLPRLYH
jgi:magnesium transporter